MERIAPSTPEQMAEALAAFAAAGKTIHVGGAFSKLRQGGGHAPAAVTVSTSALTRVLQYEPKDLTVSVESGLPWATFTRLLAANGQMVPLDPPFASQATVGGAVVSNLCGPRRRWFGSARDLVIGMQYATIEGKRVQSGGMVVKNVAGLDTGKLLIGSLGTLAVVLSINFKLAPAPPCTRTFLFHFTALPAAIQKRNSILQEVLQPWSIDLVNPHASGRIDEEGWVLAVQAGGSQRLVERYELELAGTRVLADEAEQRFWERIREFIPEFLREKPDGYVVRISTPIEALGDAAASAPVPFLARAGNGVAYALFTDADGAANWLKSAAGRGWRGVIEFAGADGAGPDEAWPNPGPELEVMRKVKQLYDSRNLLNRGRLYGRI